jgi:hypothetical protein
MDRIPMTMPLIYEGNDTRRHHHGRRRNTQLSLRSSPRVIHDTKANLTRGKGRLTSTRPPCLDLGVAVADATPTLGRPVAKPLAIHMTKGKTTTVAMLPSKKHPCNLPSRVAIVASEPPTNVITCRRHPSRGGSNPRTCPQESTTRHGYRD